MKTKETTIKRISKTESIITDTEITSVFLVACGHTKIKCATLSEAEEIFDSYKNISCQISTFNKIYPVFIFENTEESKTSYWFDSENDDGLDHICAVDFKEKKHMLQEYWPEKDKLSWANTPRKVHRVAPENRPYGVFAVRSNGEKGGCKDPYEELYALSNTEERPDNGAWGLDGLKRTGVIINF